MARAPYRGVELTEALRPVASPVDTFVTAQAPSRDTNLQDLARSLSGLGGSLQSFVQKRDAETEEADRLRGEAAFYSQTEQGYAAGVASDAIPAQMSPAFMRGKKMAEGNVAGGQLQEQLAAAYETWPDKGNTDPNAFNGFLTGFLKDRIKTDDPDVLRGLLPHVRQAAANLQQRHIGDVSRINKESFVTTLSAQGEQVIDAADKAGLGSKTGTDYQGVFNNLDAIRADGLKKGLSEADLNNKLIDTVTTAAITKRDPKLLGFLDRKVPGKDYTWANTPYGRDAQKKTIETLERMGRESIKEDEQRRRQQKAADKDAVTSGIIAVIEKNLNGPLPEELLARGEKLDPEFRVKAVRWRETLRKGEASDPGAMLRLTDDILQGGGLQRVQRGIEEGVLRNSADVMRLAGFAKSMTEHGPDMKAILSSAQATTIVRTIRERTLTKEDATKFLDPDGMSDLGLAAQRDYRLALLTWRQKNPQADLIEQEKMIAEIGATILNRIGKGDGGRIVYDRDSFPGNNPFQPGLPPPEAGAKPTAPASTPAPQRQLSTAPNPFVVVDDFGRPLETASAPQQVAPPVAPSAAPPAPVSPAPAATPAAPPPAASPVQQVAPPAPAKPATSQPREPAIPQTREEWFNSLKPAERTKLDAMAAASKKPVLVMADEIYQTGLKRGFILPRAEGAPPAPGTSPAAPATPAPVPGKRSSLLGSSPAALAPDGTLIETASLPSSPGTEEVGRAFSRAIEGAYVGRATTDGTTATLNGHTFTGATTPDQVARRFEGFGEANPQHRQALTAFLSKSAGQTIDPVKVPWCAAFVDAVLDASGKAKRGSLRAVDFLDYGTGTAQPTRGDVVVFKSMAAGSTGHVGFVVGIEGDRVRYIAGNDDNRVQEDTLPLSKVAGFRRPPEAGTPTAFAPSREVAERFASVLGTTAQPAGGYASRELQADPRAARILDFVAGPESGGNYNAVFGNAGATEDLSKRTLDQTIAWSRDRGTASSATGRFQFMAGTLEGLKRELGLSGREAFTPELQDRMALALLNRRGYRDFATGKLGTEDFANELAKEWAALPNFTTGRSHYAGDGVNKALVSPSQVRAALEGTGAFPGSRLARAAQTLTSAVSSSGVAGRIRGMFSRPAPETPAPMPATPPASDPYANAPAGQAARLRETNPDPVGNSETVLAQVPPQLAEVIRKAQSDNPKRRFVVVRSGDGEGAEFYPVDAEGRVVFEPGPQQAAMSAIRLAADQLGVGVNLQGLREGRPRVTLAQTRRA